MGRLKLKLLSTLCFSLLLCSNQLSAQEEELPKRWKVDAGLGISMALGEFKNGEVLSFWGQAGGSPVFNGIRKRGHGFAKTGPQLRLDIAYRVSRSTTFGLQSSFQNHQVNEKLIEQVFVINGRDVPMDVNHDPYKAQMLIPYISIQLTEVEPQFSFRFGYGYGRLSFPSYFLIDSSSVRYGSVGDSDALNSGVIMGGVRASYPFKSFRAFANIDYTSANFEYLSVNGNSANATETSFNDAVNLKTLNLSIGLSYLF